jgi:hypothetical protein
MSPTTFCGCDDTAVPPHLCDRHKPLEPPLVYNPTPILAGTLATHTVKIPFTHEIYKLKNQVQTFETGATRNTDEGKFDYEAFLSPSVLHEYGRFMHEHRQQKDGSLREGDNWQKGIPLAAYMKSLVRHLFDLWAMHRGRRVINPDTGLPHTKKDLCCAIMFNAMGYLKELIDPSLVNIDEAVK